jgi:hypothetical protein
MAAEFYCVDIVTDRSRQPVSNDIVALRQHSGMANQSPVVKTGAMDKMDEALLREL